MFTGPIILTYWLWWENKPVIWIKNSLIQRKCLELQNFVIYRKSYHVLPTFDLQGFLVKVMAPLSLSQKTSKDAKSCVTRWCVFILLEAWCLVIDNAFHFRATVETGKKRPTIIFAQTSCRWKLMEISDKKSNILHKCNFIKKGKDFFFYFRCVMLKFCMFFCFNSGTVKWLQFIW